MKANNLYNIKRMNKLVSTIHKYMHADAPKYQNKYPALKGVSKDFTNAFNLNNKIKKNLINGHYEKTAPLFNKLKDARTDGDIKLYNGNFNSHFDFVYDVPKKISHKYIRPLASLKHQIPRADASIQRYHKYLANQPSLKSREQHAQTTLNKQIPQKMTNLRKYTHNITHTFYTNLQKYISGVKPSSEPFQHNNISTHNMKHYKKTLTQVRQLGQAVQQHDSKGISSSLQKLNLSDWNFYGSKPYNEALKYGKTVSLNHKLQHIHSLNQHKHISLNAFLHSWNSITNNDAYVSYNPQTVAKNSAQAKKSQIKIPSANIDAFTGKASNRKVSYSNVPTQVYVVAHPRNTHLHAIIDLTKPKHAIWLNVNPGRFYNVRTPIHTALTKLQKGQSLDSVKNVSMVKPSKINSSLIKLSQTLANESISNRGYKQYTAHESKQLAKKSHWLLDNSRRASSPITYGAPDSDFIADPMYVKDDAQNINKGIYNLSSIKAGLHYAKFQQRTLGMSHHIPKHHLHRSSDWQAVTDHERSNKHKTARRQINHHLSKKQEQQMQRKQSGIQRN